MCTLVRRSFYGMLAEIPSSESPPAYATGTRFHLFTVVVTAAVSFDAGPSLCGLHTESMAYALLVLLASLSLESFGESRTPDKAGRWHVGNHIDSDDHGVLCNLPGRGPSAWLLFRFGTGAPSSSQSQLCDGLSSSGSLHGLPGVCDEAHLCEPHQDLGRTPSVREIDVIQEGERGRPICASEFSPAQDPFVADSSQLFRIVRIESRRAQFPYWAAARTGLLPEHLRGHDPDRCAEELQVAGLGGTATLAAGIFGASGRAERRAARHLCRFALAFMRSSATKRKTLGTLTGSPLPTQEARCRSGSGSCSG
jgi:hypothetical protein